MYRKFFAELWLLFLTWSGWHIAIRASVHGDPGSSMASVVVARREPLAEPGALSYTWGRTGPGPAACEGRVFAWPRPAALPGLRSE